MAKLGLMIALIYITILYGYSITVIEGQLYLYYNYSVTLNVL